MRSCDELDEVPWVRTCKEEGDYVDGGFVGNGLVECWLALLFWSSLLFFLLFFSDL